VTGVYPYPSLSSKVPRTGKAATAATILIDEEKSGRAGFNPNADFDSRPAEAPPIRPFLTKTSQDFTSE
jgi:hypothetical protein